jgi:hypothetical protein
VLLGRGRSLFERRAASEVVRVPRLWTLPGSAAAMAPAHERAGPPCPVRLEVFDERVADADAGAWVDVRCGMCAADVSFFRHHPLAAA